MKKEEKHNTQVKESHVQRELPNTDRYSTYYYISIIVVTTTRLIWSSLRPKSPQNISSFKLLCCHHSNHYLSSTHDLCS